MRTVRLLLGMFSVIGLGLLAGGVYSVRHTRQFLQTAVSAPGVVIENIWRADQTQTRRRGMSWAFYPRIRFRTTDGREIYFLSSTGSRPPSYRVNEPVTILYDPRQPSNASIRSFSRCG